MSTETINPRVIQRASAHSTPIADKTPAKATSSELQQALDGLQAEAATFGRAFINDAAVRADYHRKTQAAANEIIELVKQRKMTPHEGAQAANMMRNQIMVLARSKLTDFGLAYSKGMKANGLSMHEAQQKYALELFKKPFEGLSDAERQSVWRTIISKAGSANVDVNGVGRVAGVFGRILLVSTLAIAVHAVVEADNKPREVAKQSVGIGAGIAGGVGGGALVVALASNPAGWAVAVGTFVGAAVAGVGSAELFDYFWPNKK